MKQPIKYDPNAPITTYQKKRIMQNCSYQTDVKEEYVQWVTEDVNKRNLGCLTQAQALKILWQQEGQSVPQHQEEFSVFDSKNPKHRVILSYLYQAGWTTTARTKEVPDMVRFGNWLQTKAPVNKPLAKQDAIELEKTIKALRGVVKSQK